MGKSNEKALESFENLTFEEALARLESITKSMESGAVSLDNSLKYFEDGISLVRRCNALLDSAEKRIKILTRSPEGEIVEVDFNGDN